MLAPTIQRIPSLIPERTRTTADLGMARSGYRNSAPRNDVGENLDSLEPGTGTAEVGDGLLQALVQPYRGLPRQLAPREGDVGLALPRIVGGQFLLHDAGFRARQR